MPSDHAVNELVLPHALPPARNDDERINRLRLLRSHRVGAITFYRLIAHYKTATAALAALPDIVHKAGIRNYSACSEQAAMAEWQAGHRQGAYPVFVGEADYPPMLARIRDAPPLIWCKGNIALLHKPMLALIGTRNASSAGLRMARMITRQLAEAGFITVSGFARGIDAAVHQASLDTGTIAVFAGGIGVVYPKENSDLGGKIAERGAIVSEQPVALHPQATHFPRRNRIVAGLAKAVVVIEAPTNSGSLLTTQFALEQGRDVLAVPGNPFDARASGCNALIRDGAVLIRNAQDVLDIVGGTDTDTDFAPVSVADSGRSNPPKTPKVAGETPILPADHLTEQKVLSLLGSTPISEDQLIRDLGIAPQQVYAVLLALELNHKIQRHPGGFISITA